MVARQIGSIESAAATGAGRLPEAPEGGVQAALCGPSAVNIARAGDLKVLSALALSMFASFGYFDDKA